MKKAVLHTDGASSGNPGPSGIGAVVEFQGHTHEIAEFIGTATNNVAEYTSIIRALEKAHALGATEVDAFMDSELVVKQLNGQYRVKNPTLKPLYEQARGLLGRFRAYRVSHVRREQNTHADKLSKLGAENKPVKNATQQVTKADTPPKDPSQGTLPF